MRKNHFPVPAQSGFTLVELAIVLMIIGLLIGGILRGQELMENARIAATIQQTKAYTSAYITFRDSYSAVPGDFSGATTRLPGCAAAGSSCGNGDGNGVVGLTNLGQTSNENQAGVTSMPRVETSYFWKHLAMAHLISGVNPMADVTQPVAGGTHPAAKVGGVFSIFYSASLGNNGDKGFGNVLRLQGSPTSNGITPGGEAISPIRARQLDTKMDDGLGDSGSVTADHEWNCDGGPGGAYFLTEEKTCWMYFNID